MTEQSLFGRVEAILFDLDGTLIETDNRWAGKLARRLDVLKRVWRKADTDALGRSVVMFIETPANYAVSIAERLGMGKSFYGLANRIRRSKGIATRDESMLVEGSLDLLETVQEHYKLAVVTTRARPEAYAFVQGAQLARFFPVIITREDVFRMKPNPDPIYKAAARLGVAPERCLMIGDTIMDIRAARRAGAYAVGVLSGFGARRELERAGAHLILDYAAQLLDYLPDDAATTQGEKEEGAHLG